MAAALDRARQAGEALARDAMRARWRAHAGLDADVRLGPIFARHAAAWDDAALDAAHAAWQEAPADERYLAGTLLHSIVETRAERALAELEERELRWEATAVAHVADGRTIPYARLPIAIANAGERRERLLLERARADLVGRELAPLRRERLQRDHDLVAGAGIADGYLATFEALAAIDPHALAAECERFLRDTQAMWDEMLPEFLRRRLGITPAEATRADALALIRAPEFDAGFPPGAMEATVRVQVGSMGLDPSAGGRVRHDLGEREGKRARAFCAPVEVPDEVHLVLRPQGGAGDWRTFLHELGHALHFAHTDRLLPFEARRLGDNSVTEGYAMLFDHLLQDRGWVRRYAELPAARLDAWLRAAAFEELHLVRRYCGKLRYELALHGGEVSWDALPDLFVETLGAATGFRYAAADAFVDVDPGLYVVRYLRAWQLQAVLGEALRDRFDEDWWRNPAAGPWVERELFAHGQREPAHALAERVAGATLDFAPVVRAIEARLQ